MRKLAKLQRRESLSWWIWETLALYANAQNDRSKVAQERYFETLLSYCMNWIGGEKEDIAQCGDMQDGFSLTDLATRYSSDIRRVLVWLSAPDQPSELAVRAARFLSTHGTGIRMDISANPTFEGKRADVPLLMQWPEPCESVIVPVCKFILDQIERHDRGEALRDVIPIGLCERSGCDRFIMIERVGRRRWCPPDSP